MVLMVLQVNDLKQIVFTCNNTLSQVATIDGLVSFEDKAYNYYFRDVYQAYKLDFDVV